MSAKAHVRKPPLSTQKVEELRTNLIINSAYIIKCSGAITWQTEFVLLFWCIPLKCIWWIIYVFRLDLTMQTILQLSFCWQQNPSHCGLIEAVEIKELQNWQDKALEKWDIKSSFTSCSLRTEESSGCLNLRHVQYNSVLRFLLLPRGPDPVGPALGMLSQAALTNLLIYGLKKRGNSLVLGVAGKEEQPWASLLT